MNRSITALASFSGLVLLLACSGGDDRAAETGDADPAVRSAAAEGGLSARDAADVRDFRLTMDGVRRYAGALENLQAVALADPALEERLEELDDADFGSDASLRKIAAALDAEPRIRQAIESAGLSTREFALTNGTFIPAYLVVKMRQSGLPDAQAPAWITDEHLQFVERNESELDALIAVLESAD